VTLFKFEKRCRLLVGANDESLSVVAVCVATKIVRPLESIVATQTQLQPARLRLSAKFIHRRFVSISPANRLNLTGLGEKIPHQFLSHFSCSTTNPSELDREDRHHAEAQRSHATSEGAAQK
jgi:hypothetical protein